MTRIPPFLGWLAFEHADVALAVAFVLHRDYDASWFLQDSFDHQRLQFTVWIETFHSLHINLVQYDIENYDRYAIRYCQKKSWELEGMREYWSLYLVWEPVRKGMQGSITVELDDPYSVRTLTKELQGKVPFETQ